MFCSKCGTALPEGAVFCHKCGTATAGGGSAAASPPPAKTIGAVNATELKCPSCGAPIKPKFGEAVISCEYCGGSVALGGDGWKEVNKHTLLALKLSAPDQVLALVRQHVNVGFLRRKTFEESKVTGPTLEFIPFWLLPVSTVTNYEYQAVATGIAASIGTSIAASAAASALGNALGGDSNRRRTVVVPAVVGPVVNPTRQATMSNTYEFPIVAVKALANYQPRDYRFDLGERTLFDPKAIPAGAQVRNGDLPEEVAQSRAKAWVAQLEAEAARKAHRSVSKLDTKVDVASGELLHAPIWSVTLERKGEQRLVLIDGHAGRVIPTVS